MSIGNIMPEINPYEAPQATLQPAPPYRAKPVKIHASKSLYVTLVLQLVSLLVIAINLLISALSAHGVARHWHELTSFLAGIAVFLTMGVIIQVGKQAMFKLLLIESLLLGILAIYFLSGLRV